MILMGGAALLTLFYTRGDITALVTMYSINVFVTFSMSQLGMLRYWTGRRRRPGAGRQLMIHGAAFFLCAGILAGTLYEKLHLGGWVTVVATSAVVGICFLIRRHYRQVQQTFRRLDEMVRSFPVDAAREQKPVNPREPTAVMLVGGYGGLGIHALLSLQRLFPLRSHRVHASTPFQSPHHEAAWPLPRPRKIPCRHPHHS